VLNIAQMRIYVVPVLEFVLAADPLGVAFDLLQCGQRDTVRMQRAAVCCSVLQCVAVCCSVLQCAAVCCSVLQCAAVCRMWRLICYIAVCCSVLQCVAFDLLQCGQRDTVRTQCDVECCSELQCVAVCCSVFQCVAECCFRFLAMWSARHGENAVYPSVLQCVAEYCSRLQCGAMW